MDRMTSTGLNESVERVLTYALLWISGLVFFFIETRNRNVRWHALQSIVTFGTLSILMFGVSIMKLFLGGLPVIGVVFSFGLGLLYSALGWIIVFLWIWLMVMAWLRPNYRLPFVGELLGFWR